MKSARNRVMVSLLLLAVAVGAAIVATAVLATGWLVLLALVVGVLTGWHAYGSLVGYAEARRQDAKAKLTSALSGDLGSRIKAWAAQQNANAAAHAAPPAQNTTEAQ